MLKLYIATLLCLALLVDMTSAKWTDMLPMYKSEAREMFFGKKGRFIKKVSPLS